mgnify:CR=1 FL=1
MFLLQAFVCLGLFGKKGGIVDNNNIVMLERKGIVRLTNYPFDIKHGVEVYQGRATLASIM